MKKLLFGLGLLFTSFSTFAMTNPASVNCTSSGWNLKIEKIWDGSEIGICYFDDNRQCEEWAMYNNECPVGWLKITGFISDASRYCAIKWWELENQWMSGDVETWNCKLPNWEVKDIWDLYNNTGSVISQTTDYQDQSCGSIWNLLKPENMELADSFMVKFQEKISKLSTDNQMKRYDKLIKASDKLIEKYQNKTASKYVEIVNLLKYIKCMAGKAFLIDNPEVSVVSSGDIQMLTLNDLKEVASGDKNTINYDSGYILINVEYPKTSLVEVDESAKTFVYDEIQNFIKDLPLEVPYVEWMQYSLYITYELNNVDEKYLTIKFNLSSFYGWAHPSSYIKTFNFDKKTQEFITLQSYLSGKNDYLNQLSTISYQKLIDNKDLKDMLDLDRVKQGTAATGANFQYFNIIKDWLIVYFPDYQVWPHTMWEQSVEIKLEEIK